MADPITCGPVAGMKLERSGRAAHRLLQASALAVTAVGGLTSPSCSFIVCNVRCTQ